MKFFNLQQAGIAFALIAGTVASANPENVSADVAALDAKERGWVPQGKFHHSEVTLKWIDSSTVEEKLTLQGEGLFAFDSDILGPSSEQALANLVAQLEKLNELVSITVVGHTDALGKEKANLQLSTLRAKSVQAFLRGAYPEIPVKAMGMGEVSPVHSNSTLKGRRLNRRVEILATVATAEK